MSVKDDVEETLTSIADAVRSKTNSEDPIPFSLLAEKINNLSGIDFLDVYPVGFVYISYNSTSPASLFGGTWFEMKGVFPYFNHGTGTGGSNTHTLTVNEMPSHNHNITNGQDGGTVGWQNQLGQYKTTVQNSSMILKTGGGQSHNNMPAYQSFYAWRRTE